MIGNLNNYIGLTYDQYDCWQFICHYYANELGIVLPSFSGEYRDGDDREKIGRIYSREMARDVWPKVDNPVWPDLVVFKIDGKQWHAGIVIENKKMLHTQRACNSVLERYTNLRWKNRVYGFYRYQE